MNSLSYLSRQLDVLATTGSLTPPSTPTMKASTLNASGRPPRAKSYSKIVQRRQGLQHQQQQHQQGGDGPHTTNKRSFSSPALWSFRKPTTLTPNSSVPGTPALAAPGYKRTTSYDFANQPMATPATPETAPIEPDTTSTPLLLRLFTTFWQILYALWLRLSGYLVVPSLLVPRRVGGGRGGPEGQGLKNAEDGDSTADEKEESEDDGIVTRAPKRSSLDADPITGATLLSSSYSMSNTTLVTQEQVQASTLFPQQDLPTFSLEPPSPEEVQERTETPRIDVIPPPQRARAPSLTVRRRTEPPTSSTSSSLLPNPLSTSLLVKSSSSMPSSALGMGIQHQNQQPGPSRKMQGLRLPKTLVLDLDETLIHSTSRPLRAHAGGGLFSMGGLGFGFGEKRGREAGHMVEVVLGGRCTLYHVYKRPFVDYFLRKVSSWYTLVIFTASMQEYADPVIDWLDAGRGILSRRMFRESCTQLPNGSYTKDLSLIEQDLSRVCLIDNSPVSYNVNPANGIPIEGWISDPSDEALLHLLPVLDSLRFATDVRRILGIRLFN